MWDISWVRSPSSTPDFKAPPETVIWNRPPSPASVYPMMGSRGSTTISTRSPMSYPESRIRSSALFMVLRTRSLDSPFVESAPRPLRLVAAKCFPPTANLDGLHLGTSRTGWGSYPFQITVYRRAAPGIDPNPAYRFGGLWPRGPSALRDRFRIAYATTRRIAIAMAMAITAG